jgi:hypothetical protein
VKRYEKYRRTVGKSEMIWKIWKNSKLKCEMILKYGRKEGISEMIWKIWK